jgi:hypothetical protein
MNGLGIYTTTVQVESRFSKWAQKIGSRSRRFSKDLVYDVRLYSVKPTLGRIDGAVSNDGDNIVVDLTKALPFEMFRLEVMYRMDEETLGRMIHSRSSTEPLQEAMKYRLSAQLTDPSSLGKGFSEVDVEEFPLTARVHIQEDIDTAMPVLKTYKRLRAIENEMLSEYDPHGAVKILRLQKERHTLRRRIMQEDPTEALRQLLVFLRPTKFLSYLHAEEDFRLHRCQWGTDMFETLGSLALPKSMEITTRTDLSLAKPTSKGTLLYQSGRFTKDISEIVDKKPKMVGPG